MFDSGKASDHVGLGWVMTCRFWHGGRICPRIGEFALSHLVLVFFKHGIVSNYMLNNTDQ